MKDRFRNDSRLDITIAITCYNEAHWILDTIQTVSGVLDELGYKYEIIVIDDVSRDGSAQKVQSFIDSNPNIPVYLQINTHNQGYANNFMTGAFLGEGNYYRLCCGDNSESKEILLELFKHMGKADIIIPFYKQDEITGKTCFRRNMSKIFTGLVNVISGYNMGYYNGNPIYRRSHVLRWPSVLYGFAFQADVLTRLLDEGASYLQIPAWGNTDRKGKSSSSVTMRNILSVSHTIMEIIIRRVRRYAYYKDRKKCKEIRLD